MSRTRKWESGRAVTIFMICETTCFDTSRPRPAPESEGGNGGKEKESFMGCKTDAQGERDLARVLGERRVFLSEPEECEQRELMQVGG